MEKLIQITAPCDLKSGEEPLRNHPHHDADLCDIDQKTWTIKRDVKAGEPYFVCRGCVERIKYLISVP